ncbi:hypothetical protein SynA1560_02444 [Synechococcus sp. A15-60]|nr:hypothetical protein SynA1560_02444 [Synechococcus sp. A15-60]
MWADHLSIARCCACMAELDLSTAISTMGAGLHLLQRDLILESVRTELEQKRFAKASLLYSGCPTG